MSDLVSRECIEEEPSVQHERCADGKRRRMIDAAEEMQEASP